VARTKKAESEGLALQLRFDSSVAAVDFTKVEKNLSSIGFFTATNLRVKGATQKTVTFIREIDGKKVETRAVILPSAKYGLPVTSDQDKYLAFQKLVCEIRQRNGKVANPIGFTSAELLRILGKEVRSGKNYDDVAEWMKRMTLTGINSQGVVYLAGRKRWADKTFHVFETAVSVGQEMPDGTVADMNYIWLSEWQLENINNNYLLPIDLETYRKLKNHIAKALVPLLQIWLYASRSDGRFEKRYTELCQILNIRRWEHLSKIKQVLSPSFDELTQHGYLADWKIEPTCGGEDFKIIMRHGEKFHRDQRMRLGQREQVPLEIASEIDQTLLDAMITRGIHAERARQLIASASDPSLIIDQLEWGDRLVAGAPGEKFYNPPGFYVYLIREGILPPRSFESSRKRRLRGDAQIARQAERKRLAEREMAYEDYQKHEIERYIAANQQTAAYQKMINDKRSDLLKHNKSYTLLPPETLSQIVDGAVRSEIARALPLLTFEEYCESEPQMDLFERS
jgi:hypothetical protein